MSTRSSISVKTKDGIKSIYAHWDGYPKHNGSLLVNYYNDQENAESIVDEGSVSSLKETVKDSVFYSRDRNEDLEVFNIPAWNREVIEAVHSDWLEFHYYWDGASWNCVDYNFANHDIYSYKHKSENSLFGSGE